MQLSDERTLAIGTISLAIGFLIQLLFGLPLWLGFLIGRFLHFEYAGFAVTDFVEGVLIGLSLVMNVTYLIRKRKK